MSSTNLKFLVWAPYQTDADLPRRRSEIRAQHHANMMAYKEKGVITQAYPLASPESVHLPASEKKLLGSSLTFEVPSVEDVRKILEGDVFWTGNVWDKEKIVIGHIFT